MNINYYIQDKVGKILNKKTYRLIYKGVFTIRPMTLISMILEKQNIMIHIYNQRN